MERFSLILCLLVLLLRSFSICGALNSEGLALLCFRDRIDSDPYGVLASWGGGDDPCSWFGVGCCNGKVVRLNLKDLCLGGTLTPMLGQLSNMKFLILHNNSFSGPIPKEIGQLKKLEILDLGHNNLSGPLPSEIGFTYPLKLLILSNNRFLVKVPSLIDDISVCPELNDLSDFVQEACWNKISATRNTKQIEVAATKRRLLQKRSANAPPEGQNVVTSSGSKSSPSPPPSPSPSTSSTLTSTPSPAPSPGPSSPPPSPPISRPLPKEIPKLSPSSNPSTPEGTPHRSRTVPWTLYISIAVGVSFLLSITAIFLLFCQNNKVVMVRPWTTGLSGQLQKALVTGVPRLKRAELETACEDFSNIVGSFRDSTLYKGTLSSGVEIAVISSSVMSSKDWSKHLEAQFRKKIETLAKVSHKNFVNLLGYCEEEEPFTRMMVLEYAPNGTLFEHLHVKESEHLDWPMRLRIAMGVAYCLDHMHQRSPPIAHKSLHSAVISLTDDYAAKISDFDFYNVDSAVKMGSGDSGLLEASPLDRESNVYNFGIMLLEMMTGRLTNSENEGPLLTWALNYLNGAQPLRLMMDSTLTSFREEEASALCEVVRSCINPDPTRRPLMREVVNQLREITTIAPDGATPKLSPLWWAELEILSTDGS